MGWVYGSRIARADGHARIRRGKYELTPRGHSAGSSQRGDDCSANARLDVHRRSAPGVFRAAFPGTQDGAELGCPIFRPRAWASGCSAAGIGLLAGLGANRAKAAKLVADVGAYAAECAEIGSAEAVGSQRCAVWGPGLGRVGAEWVGSTEAASPARTAKQEYVARRRKYDTRRRDFRGRRKRRPRRLQWRLRSEQGTRTTAQECRSFFQVSRRWSVPILQFASGL